MLTEQPYVPSNDMKRNCGYAADVKQYLSEALAGQRRKLKDMVSPADTYLHLVQNLLLTCSFATGRGRMEDRETHDRINEECCTLFGAPNIIEVK